MNDTEIMHELAANMLLVSSVNFFFNVLGGSALKSCWLETLFIKNKIKKKNYVNQTIMLFYSPSTCF